MKKTAIYLRVSTTEQALDGYGLEAQRAKCEAMATVKGWPVMRTYADEGISGTKDESERQALAELLQAIEAKEVEAVIIASLDRLGRSTRLVLRLVDVLDAAGVDLVSCKESLDTSTPAGRFVLRMFASLAELERDNIVERTTAGRDAKGRETGEKGGRVPLGYTRIFRDGKAIRVDVDMAGAVIVRRIFVRRRKGATLTQIANELNRDKLKTPRGRGWHASSVRAVLANERKYKGGKRGESVQSWPGIL
jgi:site-specific DNA recombinase